MKFKNLLLLDCSEAVKFCDKTQYRESNFAERLKLRLHFFLCQACRKYHADNTKLSHLIRKAGIQTCTEEEKKNFRNKLETEISKSAKQQ